MAFVGVRHLEHQLIVYRRVWRGTAFSTLLSPILFLSAMGLALGSFMPGGVTRFGGVSYLAFLAPGLVAAQAMQTATLEGSWPLHAGFKWLKTFEGASYVDQAAYVGWLHGLWRFRRIYSDASAHAVNDLLRSKSLPVEPVTFSLQGKVELYSRLKAALEADRLVLPQHAALLRELSTFEYRISTSGNLLLHAVEGGHDDYPDSLALAARTLTRERGRPGIVVFPHDLSSRARLDARLGMAPPTPFRRPEGHKVVGTCAACGQPIDDSQAWVLNGPRHATCPTADSRADTTT